MKSYHMTCISQSPQSKRNHARRCLAQYGLFGEQEFAKRYPDDVANYWALQRTKPPKKRKGKRGMPTLVQQIWAYLQERFAKSPTDERIHRAIVEHSKFRRDATISVEIEHGGNVQEFSFPPSTSIQTFRKISLALRRDFEEGLKIYQEFCRYDGMGGR